MGGQVAGICKGGDESRRGRERLQTWETQWDAKKPKKTPAHREDTVDLCVIVNISNMCYIN